MALIQALLLGITRSAGKILNTVFGWATTMLFGKVPESRQIYLSAISFGSVIWLAVVLGIIWPTFGTWLLAAVPLPEGINDNIIRLIMFGIALLIPPIIGFISLFMLDRQDRPKGGKGKWTAVVKGYPYTVGLAFTLVMMLVIAPILKIQTMMKRWEAEHLPVIVESKDYLGVVDKMEQALTDDGFKVKRAPAGKLMQIPTKFLSSMAGGSLDRMVADQLTLLRGKEFEAELHPSDLVVRGKKEVLGRVQASLTVALAFSKAYMTWTKDANEIEDRLEDIRVQAEEAPNAEVLAQAVERLKGIERDIHDLNVTHDEWQTLFREKLLVERMLLQDEVRRMQEPDEDMPSVIGQVLADAQGKNWQKKGAPLAVATANLLGKAGLKTPQALVLAGWKVASLIGTIQTIRGKLESREAAEDVSKSNGHGKRKRHRQANKRAGG